MNDGAQSSLRHKMMLFYLNIYNLFFKEDQGVVPSNTSQGCCVFAASELLVPNVMYNNIIII